MTDINIDSIARILAVEMTTRTGEIWRMVPHVDRFTHIESPTACLSVREAWRTKRLEIQATAPHRVREKTTGELITCDPSRSPEAIARDIENRLLPHARAHLTESIEFNAQKTRERNRIELRRNFFRRWMPKDDHNGDPYGNGISAHFTYNGMVKLTFELSLKDAIKLLKERIL